MIQVDNLYLIDVIYKSGRPRRRGEYALPFSLAIGIDTGEVTDTDIEEAEQYFTLIETKRYISLFNEKRTTFRYIVGTFYSLDAKDDFEKLKNIAYCDLELLLNSQSDDRILKGWSTMFIRTFTVEKKDVADNTD